MFFYLQACASFVQWSSGQKMGFLLLVAKLLIRSKKLGGAKMAQTSVTMPSMVRIVGRAPAVDEKM